MARKLRIQYPGAIYQVMNRGGRREAVFEDDQDRERLLKTVCDYVHLNPARAKGLKPGQPLSVFAWSSYPQYLAAPSRRPKWLRVDRLVGAWGVLSSTVLRGGRAGNRPPLEFGHFPRCSILKG